MFGKGGKRGVGRLASNGKINECVSVRTEAPVQYYEEGNASRGNWLYVVKNQRRNSKVVVAPTMVDPTRPSPHSSDIPPPSFRKS